MNINKKLRAIRRTECDITLQVWLNITYKFVCRNIKYRMKFTAGVIYPAADPYTPPMLLSNFH